MKLSELKLNDDNPRTIKKEKLEKLANSIKDFPKMMIKRPIVYDENKVIIGGNMRYRAIKSLGMKEIPEEWTSDASDFTEEERKRFIMQDNAEMGEHDWDLVANQYELEDLDAWGIDVPYADSTEEVEEDEAPEVSSEPPVSQLGEVYQLGRHRVMCGDSTDFGQVSDLLNGQEMDLVYTDPPYGIDIVQGKSVGGSKGFGSVGGGKIVKVNQYSPVIGDDTIDTAVKSYELVVELEIPKLVFWGGNYYASALPNSPCWLVWDKNNTGNFADCEMAWTNLPNSAKLYKQTWNGMIREGESEKRVHPTQKPINLAIFAFNNLGKDNNSVLDLFLGSGSTLIACEQTDRTCYGMELDPKYVDVIRKRYAKFTAPDDTLPVNWEELTPAISGEEQAK